MDNRKRYALLISAVLGISALYSIAPATDGSAQWSVVWKEIHPPELPPAELVGACMAYDEKRQVVVLFAGSDFGSFWEWDGQIWTEHSISSSAGPLLCERDGMVFDLIRETILAAGPSSEEPADSGSLPEIGLWEWNGRDWTQLLSNNDTPVPASRLGHSIAVDHHSGELLLYGGFLWPPAPMELEGHLHEKCVNDSWPILSLYDTWLLSEDRTQWTQPEDTCRLPAGKRIDEAAADSLLTYDGRTNRIVLIRNLENLEWDSWVWTESSWAQGHPFDPALSELFPLGQIYHSKLEVPLILAALLDPENPRLEFLFFDGERPRLLNVRNSRHSSSFWERLWGARHAEAGFPASVISYAYDSTKDEIIIFGADEDGESAMWSIHFEEIGAGSNPSCPQGCACS